MTEPVEPAVLASVQPLPSPSRGECSDRFSELSRRISNYEKGKESFRQFNPDKPGPWLRFIRNSEGKEIQEHDYEAFLSSLKLVEEDVRVYRDNLSGLSFVIKEPYARILDEIRSIRLEIEDPEKTEKAQQVLAAHPCGKRALPEDFLPLIDELVDSSYFSRILLLDDSNVHDFWVRQVKRDHNAGFISSAAVEPNGDLLFFKREIEEHIRTDLFHEWAHRLAARYPDSELAFRKAILLEQTLPGWYFPSSYALTDFGEHWAVYGERMLSASPELFQDVIDKSPPRAVIWMRTLSLALNSEKAGSGKLRDELKRRASLVETGTASRASEIIMGFLKGPDDESVKRANELLLFLASKPEFQPAETVSATTVKAG